MLERVKFGTSSSMPPKVNYGIGLRQISKLAATANVEALKELPHDEWSCLCVLSSKAPASYSP
jgi:hypothetical protein